jgi:hypothetical protein
VNDWLKFAEAKNAALVVFDSAVLVVVAQAVSENPRAYTGLRVYVLTLCTLVAASLVVGLFSFLPRTSIPVLTASELPGERDNLIFFGAAKKYTARDYVAAAEARYGGGQPKLTPWEQDIAEQIVTNARIADWKYACFKVALGATIWGLLTPVVGPLVFGLLYAWSKTRRI